MMLGDLKNNADLIPDKQSYCSVTQSKSQPASYWSFSASTSDPVAKPCAVRL